MVVQHAYALDLIDQCEARCAARDVKKNSAFIHLLMSDGGSGGSGVKRTASIATQSQETGTSNHQSSDASTSTHRLATTDSETQTERSAGQWNNSWLFNATVIGGLFAVGYTYARRWR